MKLLPLILALLVAGCAIPNPNRAPWDWLVIRSQERHTPLMLGHPDIVSADDELETPSQLSP